MSKSTETTNDRVPRVLVRFGKHPSSVWKHHRVYGNTIERGETPINCGETPIERGETSIERGETPIERGETSIERGETWGRCRGVAEAYRGVAEALPRRAGLSEREDAGRGGVPLDESLGGVGVK